MQESPVPSTLLPLSKNTGYQNVPLKTEVRKN